MANTFTIAGKSLDAENNVAYAGRYMAFRITSVGSDTEDAASYPRSTISFLIAADGTWGGTLWVNGDSGITCLYEVKEPSGQRIEFIFPTAVATTTVRYEFALENYLASAAAAQLSPALGSHIADLNNPHVVTPAQLGLASDATDGNFLVGDGSTFVAESGAVAQISLGVLSAGDGANIGLGSSAVEGGAFGVSASATTGGAIGQSSSTTTGGAVGNGAVSTTGGAAGASAIATTGFAGGENAQESAGGVQLGSGVNGTASSIQFLSSGTVTAAEFGLLSGAETVASGGLTDDDTVVPSSAAVLDALIVTTTPITATTYTTVADDKYVLANNASGVTITLLAAITAGDGFELTVKNINSAGVVTVDGDGTETIDGDLTKELTSQYDSFHLVCDGSNWNII